MVDFVKVDKDEPQEKPKKSWFSFKKLFLVFIIFLIVSSIISSISYTVAPKVAVIPIKGTILSESDYSLLYGESISSRGIANQIRTVADDTSYQGLLLDINSGGGSAVASEEIAEAVKYAKGRIPVYAYAGDIAASGAFWVGTSADKFYSSELSLLGSIGVTMAGLSFEEFIEEYNITYRRLTAGEYKDIGSPYRAMTEEEEIQIQQILDTTHDIFISHVAEARNLDEELVREWSQGQIFLGTTAQEIGFIDEIKLYDDVLNELKNGSEVLVVEFGVQESLLGSLGVETSILPSQSLGLMFE